MTKWRKQTVSRRILDQAKLGRDVAAIVRETGAKPETVRQVLRRAHVAGEIHIQRFQQGRSALAIRIGKRPEISVLDVDALNNLMLRWNNLR